MICNKKNKTYEELLRQNTELTKINKSLRKKIRQLEKNKHDNLKLDDPELVMEAIRENSFEILRLKRLYY